MRRARETGADDDSPKAEPPSSITRNRSAAESIATSSASQRLRVEYWPVERLKPYERNPRKNDKAVDRIRACIREFGFAVPILAKSDGEVIDGHLRLKGAIAEKMREVPVVPCDGWTDGQVKAFRLMVYRSVTWAEWDEEVLALELQEIQEADFDLSITGFDPGEIDGLLALEDDEKANAAPPLPESPVSQVGISGCSGSTECSAVTRRARKLSRCCWASASRGSWSQIRRTASSWIPNGATEPGSKAVDQRSRAT
jgi:hypothetical protein